MCEKRKHLVTSQQLIHHNVVVWSKLQLKILWTNPVSVCQLQKVL